MLSALQIVLFTVLLSKDTAHASKNSRIIGGNSVPINQFPFMAALVVESPGMTWFCGGTLYLDQWIVTAGQCVNGASTITISLGSASLQGIDENRLRVSSSEYFLHPEYNTDTLENDIGLIKLRMPITFTDYIKPVNFLAVEELWNNTHVSALGWGQTSDASSALSSVLQQVRVTTLYNEECRVTYGNQIKDNMVCVEGNYNEGACHGDTGSPLLLVRPRDQHELVGISSFVSFNGCESTDPSGYTRVYSHKEWILGVVNNSSQINV